MEERLCCWALAMQKYNFSIKHHKGSLNTNADALSRLAPESVDSSCALTATTHQFSDVTVTQQTDTITSTLIKAYLHSDPPLRETN